MASIRGWKNREREELLSITKCFQSRGEPLSHAFAAFAKKHGRKADSVRNYYYAMILEAEARGECPPGIKKNKIKTFSQKESESLMRSVLTLCAVGHSVRGAISRLSSTKTQALRLQNKYRNLLKCDETTVLRIMNELKETGAYYDPYKKLLIKIQTPTKILTPRSEKAPSLQSFAKKQPSKNRLDGRG